MYYKKEKQILISLICYILILGFYSLHVYNKYIAGNPDVMDDFKFWGKAFLFMIPVIIVAEIVIHIVFAIINKIVTNEDIPTINDERDKLIELKAIKISHWVFGFGFVMAMGSQAIGMQPWVMFITLISSCLISTILESITKIYLYRKGF
jgi:cell division protein FtsL